MTDVRRTSQGAHAEPDVHAGDTADFDMAKIDLAQADPAEN